MREQMDKKAIQKRSEQLHFLDAQGPNKHTVFVDSDEEDASGRAPSASSFDTPTKGHKKRKLEDFDVAGHFDTHPELLGKRSNRLRLSQLEKGAFKEPTPAD